MGREVFRTSHRAFWLHAPVLRMDIRRVEAGNASELTFNDARTNVPSNNQVSRDNFVLLPTTNRNDTREDEQDNKNAYKKSRHVYLTRERHRKGAGVQSTRG
ncbi:uncharacterized protein LACBIDRAFT_303231 [Laccaria bicolor S238N-H82]|uniref:Predicted protein n=1 Tax=Laccaria bicolor (strain S238N-H82 / ATCC MYA-4686) TaxID=486041 RepID=B0DD46_LACBS|nr:uncharacterized protein LACBIDRAFT_298568 [Laccaria bicolor S238N-H82]XP_001883908.1 uncharacterized protein LACBIDRAFT_303231 [Laccaria bicolor S238N-H82]EDR05350.1 predicted protein [Laccaria bicolor S238N-H82]EDR07411.1 predicted protein [Laccaria bicolor S238N-H82]|eukprot:XP_001881803.1 predicted protein [Laccaria bicolor S238N-H82]